MFSGWQKDFLKNVYFQKSAQDGGGAERTALQNRKHTKRIFISGSVFIEKSNCADEIQHGILVIFPVLHQLTKIQVNLSFMGDPGVCYYYRYGPRTQ